MNEYSEGINDFLKNINLNNNYIFYGPKGLGKYEAACSVAADVIGNFESNPDAMIIKPDGDSIKHEQIVKLYDFVSYKAIASLKVVIIDDANLMTLSAQNSILKLLEDKKEVSYILICHNLNSLLPTIRSRCIIKKFDCLSNEQMHVCFPDAEITALELSHGRPGIYSSLLSLTEGKQYLQEVRGIVEGIQNMQQKRELLAIFHLLREKDKIILDLCDLEYSILFMEFLKNVFFKSLKLQSGIVISEPLVKKLASCYKKEELLEIIAQISKHILALRKGNYNRNDFFELIMCFINE